MSETVLRDRNGNRIGSREQRSNADVIGRDRHGNRVGTYDAARDRTLDRNGNLVGYGDLLAILIEATR